MAQEYRAKGSKRPVSRGEEPRKGPHKYRWAFHGAPVSGPGGAVPFNVPEEIADDLGRHLERLSFWTRGELLDLADADGVLDVTDLPEAKFRHDPPPAGPDSWLNPGPWVPVSTPKPEKADVDLDTLSDEEAALVEAEADAVKEALRRRSANVRRAREGLNGDVS